MRVYAWESMRTGTHVLRSMRGITEYNEQYVYTKRVGNAHAIIYQEASHAHTCVRLKTRAINDAAEQC